MNLLGQATQPPRQEYTGCLICGKPLKRSKPSKAPRKYCSLKCHGEAMRQVPRRLHPAPTEEEIRIGRRRIALTSGQFSIVDADQFDFLTQWNWVAIWKEHSKNFVAMRNSDPDETGRRKTIFMHRVVMGATDGDGTIVDHKDHDGLHNWKQNLRYVNLHQNARNARKLCKSTSRFKGVTYRRPWLAYITVNRKKVYLGAYETEEEAGEAYRLGAIKYFGEFACAEVVADGVTIKGVKSEEIGVVTQ